jgi:hypothetical protein
MPPKKKLEKKIEHKNATVGKSNIRKLRGGKEIIKGLRRNVLMYIEKLEDREAGKYSGLEFQARLSTAFSDYHEDFPGVFGNKEAGQLMATLLGTLDMSNDEWIAEFKRAYDRMRADRDQAENTLSWLQELVPVDAKGRGRGQGRRAGKTLSAELEGLSTMNGPRLEGAHGLEERRRDSM